MSTIDALIEQAEKAKKDKEQQEDALLHRIRGEARQALTDGLGEGLYCELAPYVEVERYEERGEVSWITLAFAPAALQLCPFSVTASNGGTFVMRGDSMEVGKSEVAKFMLWMRQGFDAWDRKHRYELANRVAQRLRLNGDDFLSHEEVEATYLELMRLDPSHADDWNSQRTWYLVFLNNTMAARREEQAFEQKHKESVEQHTQAMRDYLQAWMDARKANREKLAIIQGQMDVPMRYWKLRVGMAALDDEGEQVIDIRGVWVKSPEPDADGYWETLDGRRIKYYFPVSVEEKLIAPTQNSEGVCVRVRVPEADEYLVIHPGTEPLAKWHLEQAKFQPLPDKPTCPEAIDTRDERKIENALKQELGMVEEW